MTKRLVWISVCLLALTAAPATAQTVTAGVKAGLTSATLSVSGAATFEPESSTSWLAGGFLSIGEGSVRVQPEVLLSSKRFDAVTAGGRVEVATRTVEVPVLLVARLGQSTKVRPTLAAGPYLSFLSKATQTFGGVETDIEDQLKGTDAGVVFGGGLEVATGGGAVVIDVRYALGLKNVSELSGITFKSRTWMASLGYRF